MRAVRFTKAEWSWLWQLVGDTRVSNNTAERIRVSVLDKLEALAQPKESGVDAGALERALEESARGKIVATNTGSGHYARLSRQATALGATPEAAREVGAWIAAQGWLQGPLTIFTVLNKWPDWLARARATAPPKGTTAKDLGQNPGGKRPATPTTGKAPGIR